jgi:hypothetical protein
MRVKTASDRIPKRFWRTKAFFSWIETWEHQYLFLVFFPPSAALGFGIFFLFGWILTLGKAH